AGNLQLLYRCLQKDKNIFWEKFVVHSIAFLSKAKYHCCQKLLENRSNSILRFSSPGTGLPVSSEVVLYNRNISFSCLQARHHNTSCWLCPRQHALLSSF